jgi:hypothetical protein
MLHGPPGTGKTNVVRALLDEWSGWCDAAYVADADELFASANYLIELLTSDRRREDDGTQRWRVIVLEDCDRFLHAGSASASAPGMSRFLNLTDGIFGQDQNVLLLLTTNEDIARFHPAVTRPGRCLANIAFTPFPRNEAVAWLGKDVDLAGDPTLADLFQLRGAIGQIEQPRDSEPSGLYL